MAKCEVCGNEYDKAFEVVAAGQRHVFDSFECAIHRMAPMCSHCGCKVVGHGVEAAGAFFCCASCARVAGEKGLRRPRRLRRSAPRGLISPGAHAVVEVPAHLDVLHLRRDDVGDPADDRVREGPRVDGDTRAVHLVERNLR